MFRVCGSDVSASLVQSVAAASLAAFAVVWAADSLSSAVLVITSLCFGAAAFSLLLDVCPDHQLPNFLASLKSPALHSLDCDLTKNPNEPWKDVLVPVEIDRALTDLYEHILREYIYPWYGQISLDEAFVQEVRLGLRHATSVLLKRLGKLDLAQLITRKGIPLGLSHLDAFIKSSQYAGAFQAPVVDSYFDYVGKNIHTAAFNREREVHHIQNATRRILPLVVPKRALQSNSATTLLTDILSGAVLQPVMDLLADPDTINLILEVAFDPEPSKTFPPPSGQTTEFLKSFVTSHLAVERPPSALHMDLSVILKDQQALFYFMQYLKEEDAINQLQFCLSIEEFNKRMMTPELADTELRSLHAEALEIYNLYMKPNAPSAVNVRKELVKEIAKVLGGSYRNIERLRKTTPLFKAYEEVYNSLERMCPDFYKSEQYFELLLGKRRSSDRGYKQRSQVDSGSRTTEKLEKGLSKIKQGVFGKSMEGVPDPLDTALDVAHYVNDDEKDDDYSSMGGETFADFLTSRDLNAWSVEIPRLSTSQDASGKPCFVYVIEVNRGLLVGEEEAGGGGDAAPDGVVRSWVIHRQFHEFYVLESKLTEFHGPFPADVQLPARPGGKLLFGAAGMVVGVGSGSSGHGLDVMQARRGSFETYLRALLARPALKGSDILFTFLTSESEFSASSLAAAATGLGRMMMRHVPMKLSKERGQGLVPFISAFVDQTQPLPPKPRHDYVVGAKEFDITLERPVERHPLFGNNFGATSLEPRPGHCSKYYRDLSTRRDEGIFDTLLYLAVNVFKVGKGKLQVLLGLRILFRKTLDTLVEYAIATKLKEVLSVGRVTHICQILEEALFSPPSTRTDEEKEQRKQLALKNFKDFLRPILERVVGAEQYEKGVEDVFAALQNPLINKQLAMFLFDTALVELFPELAVSSSEGAYQQ